MSTTIERDTTLADARWAAVRRKDPKADGQFILAVRTTGIYCRPTCPARAAKRENVEFFEDTAAARAAGYRACKRCKPDEPSLREQHARMVAAACRAIESAERAPTLEALAHDAGMSPFHFHRTFKAITGVTPQAYAKAHRGERIRKALDRNGTVTRAIYDAGFSSSSRFYEATRSVLGMMPSTFRDGGAEETIHFAVGESSLGPILVAMSAQGVCAIMLGNDPAALVRDLEDRFPRATMVGGDAGFESLVSKVVGLVESPHLGLDLPLDVRGTAFQQRVWQALGEIPAGHTVSYRELAERIGKPSAVRAVAQACGANPVAIAIPCHRVVRTDGSLSGYRWGVERKRALLEREARA